MSRWLWSLCRVVLLAMLVAPAVGAQTAPLFDPPVFYPSGTTFVLPRIHDMNGDGNQDIVVIDRYGRKLHLWLGTADGSFTWSTTVSTAGQPVSLTCADFDNDGDLDVAASLELVNLTQVFLGDGLGGLSTLPAFPGVPWEASMGHGDFNEDGLEDLVIANTEAYASRAHFFQGRGDGTFFETVSYYIGDRISVDSFIVRDFDGDGDLDVALALTNGRAVRVLLGNGDGTFVVGPAYTPPRLYALGGLDGGDYNGDGFLDLLSTNNNTPGYAVFLANPAAPATFTVQDYLVSGWSQPAATASADYDGDGSVDFALCDFGIHQIVMMKGAGNGTFSELLPRYALTSPAGVKTADFNHDGRPDLAVGSGTTGKIAVFLSPAPRTVSVAGIVSADCGGALPNATIDLVDADGVFHTTTTDEEGRYLFSDLPWSDVDGSGEISMAIPLGYEALTPPVDGQSLSFPADQNVDFLLACLVPAGEPRSMGYWKHQANVYLTGKGQAQESFVAMSETYPDLIFQHFFENDLNAIQVEGVTYLSGVAGSVRIDLATIQTTLTVNRGGTMLDRAKQHYLALLLNVASGKLRTFNVVSVDQSTVSEALQHVAAAIADGDPQNDELAKNIAEVLNNAQLVPEGWIDPSFEFIPYRNAASMGGVTTRLLGAHPSPFLDAATIQFQMAGPGRAAVRVYSPTGRLVRELTDGDREAGPHTVRWDGRDGRGATVSAGVYLVQLTAGGRQDRLRVVVTR